MALISRVVVPLAAALGATLACSSNDESNRSIPAPPGNVSGASSGGSAGSSGGSAAQGGMGGGGAQSGGSGGGDATCEIATCPTGGFCKMGACACPSDKQDICTGANVGGGANGICTSKMSDPNNCGECGMACPAGAACVAGTCGAAPEDLATAAGCGEARLAVAGGNLYWTESMTGKVMTVPVAGGTPTEVATGQTGASEIRADADGVYWIVPGDGATAGSSKVMKKALPLAQGAPLELVASPSASNILAIAVYMGQLYYSVDHDVHAISTDEDQAGDIIVGTAINFDLNPPDGEPSGEPAGLAVSGNRVFWTTATRQGVEGDDLDEGITGYVELGESQGSLLHRDIGTDGTFGYWVDGSNFRRAMEKPPVDIVGTPSFDKITAFAMNATDVYFAGEEGLLLKHALTPPAQGQDMVPAVALARDQLETSSVVLDATSVYWASGCVIRSGAL